MNVAELKELLDGYGDGLDVVFLSDNVETMMVFQDIDIDTAMFDGDMVLRIDVGQGRRVE